MKYIISIVTLFLLFLTGNSYAQKSSHSRSGQMAPWEIHVSSGVSFFVTSVNPQSSVNRNVNYWSRDPNPGVSVAFTKNITPSFGLEINWLRTRLSGTWNNQYLALPIAERYESPLTFKSKINQFDLMMTFNLNQIFLPGEIEDKWHLFIKPGIGVSLIKDTKAFYSYLGYYSRISYLLDAGFSYSISSRVKLKVGSTFRGSNTDNYDGVHVGGRNPDGSTFDYLHAFEFYNYNYLGLTINLGLFDAFGRVKSNRNR